MAKTRGLGYNSTKKPFQQEAGHFGYLFAVQGPK
jgi:hypothetical protein